MNTINIESFVSRQSRERYRAFIVYGPSMSKKTYFAKQLATKLNGTHIDMLDEAGRQPWGTRIDEFTPGAFKEWILNCKETNFLVVIDNIDFLINTWNETEKSEFLELVRMLNNTESLITFCFILQEDNFLKGRVFPNTFGDNRIIHISAIENI